MYIYYYRRMDLAPLALGGFISLCAPSFICQRIYEGLFPACFGIFHSYYWDELAFWLSSYSSVGITIKRERQGFNYLYLSHR